MKILDILDYIKEPKTGKQIIEKFGNYGNLINCLIKSGAARKYEGVQDNPSNIYSHIVIYYYVATGVEHKSKFTTPSPRRDYYRNWYEKRKAQKA
jgi:hypothetical protein